IQPRNQRQMFCLLNRRKRQHQVVIILYHPKENHRHLAHASKPARIQNARVKKKIPVVQGQ
ncbi:hypothetical protein DK295_15940, partial [Listeria monocytogenes]